MTQLNEQWMLSSCTQRLLQIQQQLQYYNRRQLQQQQISNMRNQLGEQISSKLSQQLISSMVMKQQAHRKLSQQQNILIHYLKQQLYQLSTTNTHYQHLLSSVNILNKQCSQLQKCKLQQQKSKSHKLEETKRKYRQLQELMNVMTTQSTTNYELVLRLRERNQVTKELVQEKRVSKEEMQTRYGELTAINSNRKHQLTQLQSYITDTTSTNTQLSLTVTDKQSQLQKNQQKLQSLQQQIRHYQLSNNKFKHVQEVAKSDNFNLKQQLMRNMEVVRKKEEVLEQLNQQRELCVLEKQSSGSNLQRLIAQSHMLKQKFTFITQSTLQSLQRFSQLQSHINQHNTQLTTLHNSLSKLSHLKSLSLSQCYSKQQQLQKQFYFIQQYIKVNSQLIGQISILIEEGERKKWLNQKFIFDDNNGNITNGNLFIDRLKNTLIITKQQLSSIQLSYSNLVQQFKSYQIHPL